MVQYLVQDANKMKKFSIVAKDDNDSLLIAKKIQRQLFSNEMSYSEKDPDIVCVVGGDGTFLAAIHKYINLLDKIVFTGINTGTLGFFIDYTIEELDSYIDDILHKEPTIERRRLIRTDVIGDNRRSYLAVNEMRVENITRTQNIDVFINDEKLETFKGNGLCVSTQAGSTAYNRALGGAVVERGLEVLQLTEVAGVHHTLNRSLSSPLVMGPDNVITLNSKFESNSLLCFDRYAINLKGVTSLIISLSESSYRIAHYKPMAYIHHLYHLF